MMTSPGWTLDLSKKPFPRSEKVFDTLGSRGHPYPQEHDRKILTPDLNWKCPWLSNKPFRRSVSSKMAEKMTVYRSFPSFLYYSSFINKKLFNRKYIIFIHLKFIDRFTVLMFDKMFDSMTD